MAKGRVFEVSTNVQLPDGTQILDEHTIKVALAHKVIKRWAYILHDKDVYSLKDEQESRDRERKAREQKVALEKEGKQEEAAKVIVPQIHVAGLPKAPHWHVVFETPFNETSTATIAKWFGVPEHLVEVKKGRGAFLDAVEYLTHESEKQQALGKHLYPDGDVVASIGFDFRAALIDRAATIAKHGRDLGPKERMRDDVLRHGKTLLQCLEDDPVLYAADVTALKRLRMDYISRQEPPRTRINYYVEGRGGVGKGLFSRGLARMLAVQYNPELAALGDSAMFFEVGAEGALFECYDGQPVIIWNDWRAFDLLKALKGRGNVFTVFDTHPTRQKQNVKYASINLCNMVNIVNSIQSYKEFLDGLAGEYKDKDGHTMGVEDKGQSYRRFPIIIPIHEADFDIMLNRGFMEGSGAFVEYMEYGHVRANMQAIAERCGRNQELAKQLEGQVMLPVLEGHKEIQARIDVDGDDEDAIREEFKDFGTFTPGPGYHEIQAARAAAVSEHDVGLDE